MCSMPIFKEYSTNLVKISLKVDHFQLITGIGSVFRVTEHMSFQREFWHMCIVENIYLW